MEGRGSRGGRGGRSGRGIRPGATFDVSDGGAGEGTVLNPLSSTPAFSPHGDGSFEEMQMALSAIANQQQGSGPGLNA